MWEYRENVNENDDFEGRNEWSTGLNDVLLNEKLEKVEIIQRGSVGTINEFTKTGNQWVDRNNNIINEDKLKEEVTNYLNNSVFVKITPDNRVLHIYIEY